jgi:hypothetical protein
MKLSEYRKRHGEISSINSNQTYSIMELKKLPPSNVWLAVQRAAEKVCSEKKDSTKQ